MNKPYQTLKEASEIFSKSKIEFVLTRFDVQQKSETNDLDILVRPASFKKVTELLEKAGYASLSHDQALGGRIKGAQVNLVKSARVKIDLHKDFTWRKARYFDIELVWKNLRGIKFGGVECMVPKQGVDIFLVITNLIFEKTYITREDFEYIWKLRKEVFTNSIFEKQTLKYGWSNTFQKFKAWTQTVGHPNKFPTFLPITLVIYSYLERLLHDRRLDVVSLLYYFFFRTRFFINGKLPYN